MLQKQFCFCSLTNAIKNLTSSDIVKFNFFWLDLLQINYKFSNFKVVHLPLLRAECNFSTVSTHPCYFYLRNRSLAVQLSYVLFNYFDAINFTERLRFVFLYSFRIAGVMYENLKRLILRSTVK